MWREIYTASTFSICEVWYTGFSDILFEVGGKCCEEFIPWICGISVVVEENKHGGGGWRRLSEV